MGDLAVHVAKTAVRRAPEVAVVPEIRGIITNMGNCADAVDTLHRQLFTVLLDASWPHTGCASHYSAARCRPTAGAARSSFGFSSGGGEWGGVSVSGRV